MSAHVYTAMGVLLSMGLDDVTSIVMEKVLECSLVNGELLPSMDMFKLEDPLYSVIYQSLYGVGVVVIVPGNY